MNMIAILLIGAIFVWAIYEMAEMAGRMDATTRRMLGKDAKARLKLDRNWPWN
jgi:hypothetical protein